MRKRGSSHQFASFESEREAGTLGALASEEDVEANAIRSQQRTLIEEALDTLSTKERAALVLRDLEGLSTEEVARVLGSSQTTVRTQISSAPRRSNSIGTACRIERGEGEEMNCRRVES